MVLDRDKMKAVTRDMLLTDAYLLDKNVDDSVATLYYESVLAKHKISRAKYDSSLVWYGENAPVYMAIYQELLTEFQASTNLLDSAYVDSLEMDKIKYVHPQSDWTENSRILIYPHRKLASWRVNLRSGEYLPGDTVDLRVHLLPGLRDGEQLVSRLFVLDSALYRVATLTDTITSASPGKKFMRFVLPSFMPEMRALGVQLVYINRSSTRFTPLLMDSIVLGKRLPLVPSEELPKQDELQDLEQVPSEPNTAESKLSEELQ